MKEIEPDISVETIVSIVTDQELKDIQFITKLSTRILKSKNLRILEVLFEKIANVFLFYDSGFRQKLIEAVYPIVKDLSLEDMIEVGKNTIPGNVLTLCYFIKKIKVLQPKDVVGLSQLARLTYIDDPLMLELVPSGITLIIDLDERVEKCCRPQEIENSIRILEWLFSCGLIEMNESAIRGLYVLYSNSVSPELRYKTDVVSSMLEKRLDLFFEYLSKILQKRISAEEDLLQYYETIYEQLSRINLPVFFDFDHIKFNGIIYNGNFFFMRYIDNSGTEKILFPFDKIDMGNVQKIYDLNSATYVTPKERMGKMLLKDIFSFKNVQNISNVSEGQISLVSKMSENEIAKKIRIIFNDQNITPHGPAERADIFPHKLFINGENDLRDAAFILKGKGYPTVNLDAVSTNIIKATKLPVSIVFLIYVGNILDEAKETFIDQCNLRRKMYCFVDRIDLARLLVAYNKLC